MSHREIRIRHIDIARGLGIILVVVGHSTIEWGHYMIYMFHMPLFFFLSGIFCRKDSSKTFIAKKFKSLMVPMGIFTIIGLISSIINGLTGFICIYPPHYHGVIGPLWFLLSLFVVNIIFNFLPSNFFGVIMSFVLTFILGYIPDRLGLPNYFYLFSGFSLLFFFALGNFLGKYIGNKVYNDVVSIVIFTLISLAAFIGMYIVSYKYMHLSITDLYTNTHSENFIIWIMGSLMGISSILGMSLIIDKLNFGALLAYIGKSSLYIFALHFPLVKYIHILDPYPERYIELMYLAVIIILCCMTKPMFKNIAPSIFR